MEDLPIKPEVEIGWLKAEIAELKKEQRRNSSAPKRKPATRKRTTVKKTAQTASRPKKSLPAYRMPGEQPRGPDGRWIKAVGKALWTGTKAAVKGIGKAHKTIKQVNAAARKRARLEDRERRARLAERERKLGIRKKVRRKRR